MKQIDNEAPFGGCRVLRDEFEKLAAAHRIGKVVLSGLASAATAKHLSDRFETIRASGNDPLPVEDGALYLLFPGNEHWTETGMREKYNRLSRCHRAVVVIAGHCHEGAGDRVLRLVEPGSQNRCELNFMTTDRGLSSGCGLYSRRVLQGPLCCYQVITIGDMPGLERRTMKVGSGLGNRLCGICHALASGMPFDIVWPVDSSVPVGFEELFKPGLPVRSHEGNPKLKGLPFQMRNHIGMHGQVYRNRVRSAFRKILGLMRAPSPELPGSKTLGLYFRGHIAHGTGAESFRAAAMDLTASGIYDSVFVVSDDLVYRKTLSASLEELSGGIPVTSVPLREILHDRDRDPETVKTFCSEILGLASCEDVVTNLPRNSAVQAVPAAGAGLYYTREMPFYNAKFSNIHLEGDPVSDLFEKIRLRRSLGGHRESSPLLP